jgi:uroporphyrinogen-III synthase
VLGSVTVASIGPITSKTLRARGIEPDVEAGQYTVAGLLDALEVHFAAPAV